LLASPGNKTFGGAGTQYQELFHEREQRRIGSEFFGAKLTKVDGANVSGGVTSDHEQERFRQLSGVQI